jgi:hypothetical protein
VGIPLAQTGSWSVSTNDSAPIREFDKTILATISPEVEKFVPECRIELDIHSGPMSPGPLLPRASKLGSLVPFV